MTKLKLSGKELRAIGFREGPVISIAMNVMGKNYKHATKEEALAILKALIEAPSGYMDDPVLGLIARQLIPVAKDVEDNGADVTLNQQGISFNIFGAEHI